MSGPSHFEEATDVWYSTAMSFRTALVALTLIAVAVPASAQVKAVRKDGRLDRDVGATVNAEGFSLDSALITTGEKHAGLTG